MIAFLASSLPDSHGQESPEKSLTNSARKSLTQSESDVWSKRILGGIFGSDCLVSGIEASRFDRDVKRRCGAGRGKMREKRLGNPV